MKSDLKCPQRETVQDIRKIITDSRSGHLITPFSKFKELTFKNIPLLEVARFLKPSNCLWIRCGESAEEGGIVPSALRRYDLRFSCVIYEVFALLYEK